MHSETRAAGTTALLLAIAFSGFSQTALAQDPTAPPPPPPATYPNPGEPPPPAGYAPPSYAPPQGQGQPPPGNYANQPPPVYGSPPGYPPAPPPPPPPVNLHDGFFLRMHFGFGFTSIAGTDALGQNLKFSGGSQSLGLALGGAVAPNFIIFGNLFGTGIGDPDANFEGTVYTVSGTATVAGIGAGAAYYFQPLNLYLSGTVAAMGFRLVDPNDPENPDDDAVYETDNGLGGQAMIGKEWWISQDWGLGIAAEFVAASMKDKTLSGVTWTSTAFSLVFSATYN